MVVNLVVFVMVGDQYEDVLDVQVVLYLLPVLVGILYMS